MRPKISHILLKRGIEGSILIVMANSLFCSGKEIGYNAGNHTAFTIQLLIGLCFLTEEQRAHLREGQYLEPGSKFPGVESVLARDNRPPGSGELPPGRVPILH